MQQHLRACLGSAGPPWGQLPMGLSEKDEQERRHLQPVARDKTELGEIESRRVQGKEC